MNAITSAPAKIILFGEHSVVYGEPAIAMAINKGVTVQIKKGSASQTIVKSKDLDFQAKLNTRKGIYHLKHGKPGIIKYILATLGEVHNHTPIDIDIGLNFPIGSGMGSSAALTVALLSAIYQYNGEDVDKDFIAKKAHSIEVKVQGAASPLDTSVSTYGGLIYLNEKRQIKKMKSKIDDAFVAGFTSKKGSTAQMVKNVGILKEKFPKIMDPTIHTMGEITREAKKSIESGNSDKIGELMNINHGLLDCIGVNTKELSRMVYVSRNAGAVGSKITGSGGGGSILAYCPNKINKVYKTLNKYERAIKVRVASEGLKIIN